MSEPGRPHLNKPHTRVHSKGWRHVQLSVGKPWVLLNEVNIQFKSPTKFLQFYKKNKT